jgi:hypothetical protein
MGTTYSKITPPTSLHLFNALEKVTLQETFTNMKPQAPKSKNGEPCVSFIAFKNILGNLIPEELQQYIYSNFLVPPSEGIIYAQFVDGIARAMKSDRLHFYITLFTKGSDINCHTVAKLLQCDASLWFNLAKIDPYPQHSTPYLSFLLDLK